MRIASIQVGRPTLVEGKRLQGKPWRSGYGKLPVTGSVRCGRINLEGDGQADPRYHGGPEMAVLAYGASHYPRWREELAWPAMPHGAFAENLTVERADEESVCLGDVWEAGGVRLQVSQPRKPCSNISRFWGRVDLLQRVVERGRFGWYLRVLQEGAIAAGDEVRLVSRLRPDWTVARAMRARLGLAKDRGEAAALAALPELGDDWRTRLREQLG